MPGADLFLGIDLGTSELKTVLIDEHGGVVRSASAALGLHHAQPGWSEQDPRDWWTACVDCLDRLCAEGFGARVAGIGLSGQMHGAVLLDAAREPIRPAMLWNDTRSEAQCRSLRANLRDFEGVAGNLAMPGFTAPKLLWLREHAPRDFERVDLVLLPKDYLRLCLSGQAATDASDASGTLWLDIARRDWSPALLQAGHMRREQMPPVLEACAAAGTLRAELARRWSIPAGAPIAAGAGDNAAAAIGTGAVAPGEGFVSLGTSGVVFVSADRYEPDPASALHSFCHALPGTWHQMSVMLSAAECLRWVTRLSGQPDEAHALAAAARLDAGQRAGAPLFLPYLGGERTPHNDARARALFHGLGHEHDAAALAWAVIEGVSFGLRDGLACMPGSLRARVRMLDLVGGGARSELWAQLLADVLEIPLRVRADAAGGAAVGAARLGALAAGRPLEQVLRAPPAAQRVFEPAAATSQLLRERHARFRALYAACR
ncbi:MAG: xylulokinase [Betaproteobacteria bacterium]|nr:xylulokinase [Betaproteobacteria bacterium]MBU6513876.1 xylulokinase [Betaproteobacteria bacterium]MDE2151888.1 xylulokinase [Betaproteobacteria bacterium]MDE2477897.1 xylulokinase [Betaproteobacteria bacterium]